ncbi:phosphotransferase [Microbacterium fluvii]|uniref:Maltokinase n=1 Tax=Microbacterium fluvii TaxID=415215 RepID=A0ABW2HFN1_9MICO|nr:phosphotransferase [Microbacterium fluvii]MCU4672212.1 aminoglycoside phosphotransferase [Microbacterium fluvii]
MDSTLACLAAWMPQQRWYGAKGRRPHLRLVSWWDHESHEESVRVRTYLIADEGALPPVLYQVPIVARETAGVDASGPAVIGSPEPGTTLIDGPHDPAYTRALLRLIATGATARGPHTGASGHPLTGAAMTPHSASVLTGEQSNTSIVYDADGGAAPVICKVYRQLQPGLNPDIELQTALARAGSPHVPAVFGHLEGAWPDPAGGGTVKGSLAFAQEFVAGAQDAWRVALRTAAAGRGFEDDARTLGAATAEVHRTLARVLPTVEPTSGDRDAVAEAWRRRLTIAIAEVPDLADRRGAIQDVYDRALGASWPRLQRIHGDYHLGQVLRVPGGQWILLDFEGEPMRPMRERLLPDLALRDVAGMLRSFDYVAGSLRLSVAEHAGGDRRAREWAATARAAFLGGYAAASGAPPGDHRELLAALELDKAVYEAIYEARNRPSWVAIPLRAVASLSGSF